jgi:hypothetical protein
VGTSQYISNKVDEAIDIQSTSLMKDRKIMSKLKRSKNESQLRMYMKGKRHVYKLWQLEFKWGIRTLHGI